jgi:hypothetical protein
MKRLLSIWVLGLLTVVLATAQTAVVTRNVNLRPDASTDNNPIGKLKPGTTIQLLEPGPTGGFLHVKTANNQNGWVWGKNIQIQPSSGGLSPSPTSGQDLFSKLIAARKVAVGQPLVESGNQVCGSKGDATDQGRKALNENKNRTDQPGDTDYVDINWDDLANLPSDRVNDFQGASVAVVGFLSHKIKVENSGSGESTNCHLLGDSEVDWHMYLTKAAAQPIKAAVIVETTPRVRPSHHWTTDMLKPLVDSSTLVRIGGWLMYDFEHVGAIGTQRATVWEVHPVTRIQVQRNGQWIDLDNQQ